MSTLEERVARLEAIAGIGTQKQRVEVDLDGRFGDPVVKFDPKFWDGPSYAGQNFSSCPSDYLKKLAEVFEWQAKKDKETGKTFTKKTGEVVPSYTFKEKDAALARGWAERNRNKPAPSATSHVARATQDEIPDEMPF